MANIFDDVSAFAQRSINEIATDNNLADFAHASRIFVGSNFRLNPKNSFLFHVFIDVDPSLAAYATSDVAALTELGLMVKTADLPKYTIETKTYNSYNRPNIVQSKIKFDSITISFHDDNANRVRNFWYDYYRYYYRDSDHSTATYNTEYKYAPQDTGKFGFTRRQDNYRPFIRSIRLYSLHQKRFSEYILLNPIIKSFKHGQHTQGPEGTMGHDMVIEYENVLYSDGYTTQGNPTGFATLHYDTNPSPLLSPGGTRRVFGPGGIIDTVSNAYTDLEDQEYLSAIFKGARAANTARGMNLGRSFVSELSTYYSNQATEAIRGVVNQQLRYNNGTGYHIPALNATESLISTNYTGIEQQSSLPSLAGTSVALNGIQRKTYPLYRPVRQGTVTPPSNYNPQLPTDPGVTRPEQASSDLYIANDQEMLRTYSNTSRVDTNDTKITLNHNANNQRLALAGLYQDLTDSQQQVTNTNNILTDLASRLSLAQAAPPSASKDAVVENLRQQIANATQLNQAAQQSVADRTLEIAQAKTELSTTLNRLGSLG